jgi:DNA adenine methylase
MTTLIEPFAGTLAVALHALHTGCAEKAIVNDLDNEVVTLWYVLRDEKQALIDALLITPSHANIFEYFRNTTPESPVWKAVRLLYLSNFSFLGGGDTFRISGRGHDREILVTRLREFCERDLNRMQFLSCDFREVLGKVALRTYESEPWRGKNERLTCFVYADPPYLGRDGNGYTGFTEGDLRDLLTMLVDSGLRFAVSEFASPDVLRILADFRDVTTFTLGERRALNNRNTEILIVNYEPTPRQPALFN